MQLPPIVFWDVSHWHFVDDNVLADAVIVYYDYKCAKFPLIFLFAWATATFHIYAILYHFPLKLLTQFK